MEGVHGGVHGGARGGAHREAGEVANPHDCFRSSGYVGEMHQKIEFFQKPFFIDKGDGLGGGFGISVKNDAESWGRIVISSIFQKLPIFVNCVAH